MKADKSDPSVALDTSSSLVDPAFVSVVGVVDGQRTVKSPGKSVLKGKKKVFSPDRTTKLLGSKLFKLSTGKPARSSADSKIKALNQKWSETFNRLEALFLDKTLENP